MRGFIDDTFDVFEFFDFADQRNHNFRDDFPAGFFSDIDCRFDYRPRLHFGYFRIGYRQTASAVTKHRVKFVQRRNGRFDFVKRKVHFFRQLSHFLFGVRQEFMERRVKETNGDRSAGHCLVDSLKVASLHRQDFRESGFSAFHRFGDNHFTHRHDSVRLKEHMLRAAETDAFRAESDGGSCVARGVGVCAHMQRPVFIGPIHDDAEVTADGSVNSLDFAVVHVARAAVQRQNIALMIKFAGDGEGAFFLVDRQVAAAGHTAGAHAPCHNGGV